jgi:hypothetical protein
LGAIRPRLSGTIVIWFHRLGSALCECRYARATHHEKLLAIGARLLRAPLIF